MSDLSKLALRVAQLEREYAEAREMCAEWLLRHDATMRRAEKAEAEVARLRERVAETETALRSIWWSVEEGTPIEDTVNSALGAAAVSKLRGDDPPAEQVKGPADRNCNTCRATAYRKECHAADCSCPCHPLPAPPPSPAGASGPDDERHPDPRIIDFTEAKASGGREPCEECEGHGSVTGPVSDHETYEEVEVQP